MSRRKTIWVNENPDIPEDFDCCPICGSLGVFHFEDKEDDEFFHRCLRCLSEFHGCNASPDSSPSDRLSSVSKVIDK